MIKLMVKSSAELVEEFVDEVGDVYLMVLFAVFSLGGIDVTITFMGLTYLTLSVLSVVRFAENWAEMAE